VIELADWLDTVLRTELNAELNREAPAERTVAVLRAHLDQVALYRASVARDQWMRDVTGGQSPLQAATGAYLECLRVLAMAYSHHDGFDGAWTPGARISMGEGLGSAGDGEEPLGLDVPGGA